MVRTARLLLAGTGAMLWSCLPSHQLAMASARGTARSDLWAHPSSQPTTSLKAKITEGLGDEKSLVSKIAPLLTSAVRAPGVFRFCSVSVPSGGFRDGPGEQFRWSG